jgi:hypothetical protein
LIIKQNFKGVIGMKALFKFMASKNGRITRAIAGLIIIFVAFSLQGTARVVLIVVGLLPLLAGVFDFCIFAPFFKMPFMGEALRDALKE